MILNLKRYISLLLVLMLLIGIVPTVNAAELDSERTLPEETVSEASEQTEQTDPTEPTEPTEPTAPPGDTGDADLVDPGTASEVGDYAAMSIASTQNSIMLFDYADNGNYTTVLNSQVSCAYKPNGSGTTRTAYIKNMGWHFARYGGVAYPDDPLYCIEPWRSYAASTSGNSVDRDVTLDGSGSTQGSNVWYALPAERREAIGLILLYSNQMWDHSISVTTTSKTNNPNVPLRIATQFLFTKLSVGCGIPVPSHSIPQMNAEQLAISSTTQASLRCLILLRTTIRWYPIFRRRRRFPASQVPPAAAHAPSPSAERKPRSRTATVSSQTSPLRTAMARSSTRAEIPCTSPRPGTFPSPRYSKPPVTCLPHPAPHSIFGTCQALLTRQRSPLPVPPQAASMPTSS